MRERDREKEGENACMHKQGAGAEGDTDSLLGRELHAGLNRRTPGIMT